jgi:ATP-dependent protease ClpP protease subunit
VTLDTERDFWMLAEEAREYGIVDAILSQRELAAVAGGKED